MRNQAVIRSILAACLVHTTVSFNVNVHSLHSSLSHGALLQRSSTSSTTSLNANSSGQKQKLYQEIISKKQPLEQIRNACLSLALSCTILLTPNPNLITSAADYGSLTDQQKAVAEAWRIVDNNYIDRTFNNQDWFQIRQDAVKNKYKTNQEAMETVETFVASLGDKYTRYLPPAKYRSIVDSATGTLAGVGVEISVDKDTSKIYVSDVEPSSPALNGMYLPLFRKKQIAFL